MLSMTLASSTGWPTKRAGSTVTNFLDGSASYATTNEGE